MTEQDDFDAVFEDDLEEKLKEQRQEREEIERWCEKRAQKEHDMPVRECCTDTISTIEIAAPQEYEGNNKCVDSFNCLFKKIKYRLFVENLHPSRSAILVVSTRDHMEIKEKSVNDSSFSTKIGQRPKDRKNTIDINIEQVPAQVVAIHPNDGDQTKLLIRKDNSTDRSVYLTLLIETEENSGEYFSPEMNAPVDSVTHKFVISEADFKPTGDLYTYTLEKNGQVYLTKLHNPKSVITQLSI